MLKFRFITILSIYCISLFSYFIAYAEEKNNAYTKALNADLVTKSTNGPIHIVTLGLQGGGFIHTGSTYDIGNGGGVGLNVKININKYFATLYQFNYTYASYTPYANSSHFFDTRALLVLQRETEHNRNGLVPWLGLGISYNVGVTSVLNNYATISGYGFGFIFSGGLRYNFKKIYMGANVEYNLAVLATDIKNYYGQNYGIDPSGVRINAEIGYRF